MNKFLLCLTLLAQFMACSSLLAADEPLDHFERSIRPLLARRCWSCHSQQSGKSEGGLLLDDQQAWLAGGDSGPAIV
ncbi:MAG: c-type cytochrome domain-containing protein, partial [Planctomyces sp.]